MSLENLSNNEKKELLNITISSLYRQLYSSLTFVSIDPDTFDIDSYEEPTDPVLKMQFHMVTETVNKLKFNKQLLEKVS